MRYDNVLHKVRPDSLVVISLPVALSTGRLEGAREVSLGLHTSHLQNLIKLYKFHLFKRLEVVPSVLTPQICGTAQLRLGILGDCSKIGKLVLAPPVLPSCLNVHGLP